MSELLKSLNIKENNYGACHGPDGWIDNKSDKVIKSYNPSNGQDCTASCGPACQRIMGFGNFV